MSFWRPTGSSTEVTDAAIATFAKRCSVTKTGSQSITNGADRTVTWDAERFDTDTMHDTVTNNDRITFNTAGDYFIGADVVTSGNTNQATKIKMNAGGTIIAETESSNGNPQGYTVGTVYTFAQGDYIFVTATVGAKVNVTNESSFFAYRIG
jgi:hypothetical protein